MENEDDYENEGVSDETENGEHSYDVDSALEDEHFLDSPDFVGRAVDEEKFSMKVMKLRVDHMVYN